MARPCCACPSIRRAGLPPTGAPSHSTPLSGRPVSVAGSGPAGERVGCGTSGDPETPLGSAAASPRAPAPSTPACSIASGYGTPDTTTQPADTPRKRARTGPPSRSPRTGRRPRARAMTLGITDAGQGVLTARGWRLGPSSFLKTYTATRGPQRWPRTTRASRSRRPTRDRNAALWEDRSQA